VVQFFIKDTNANATISLALGVRLIKALQRALATSALEDNMVAEAKKNLGLIQRVFRISDCDSPCELNTLIGDLVIEKVPEASRWRHQHRHCFLGPFLGVKLACATISKKDVDTGS
jgi:hypothetical protein